MNDIKNLDNLITNVKYWFCQRGLDKLESSGQLVKLQEEVDELKEAFENKNHAEIMDAVGDITVVLIGFCLQNGLDFQNCLALAYEEIKYRKGKLVNGMFIKEVKR